jgi:hypothetical protein
VGGLLVQSAAIQPFPYQRLPKFARNGAAPAPQKHSNTATQQHTNSKAARQHDNTTARQQSSKAAKKAARQQDTETRG